MMRKDLPAQRAGRPPEPTRPRQARSAWRASAVALAAALAIGMPAQEALALALGRASVLSPLGEPLRAEIEIPQISADEAASLRAAVASPEVFRAAGMERSAVLTDLRITLQARPNGGYVLQLSGDRVVSDPFLDLVLEASWASGRIVRDYTLLIDPPAARPAASVAPLAAQVAPPPPATPAAPVAPAATSAPATSPTPGPSAAPAASAPASAPQGAAPAAAAARTLTVRRGQTASRIAAANKPATVSLDQMLVAMLRANPDAFIRGNINRLKAGAVIDLPTQEEASAVNPREARQTIVAQSRDFSEFRRRLAESVAATPPAGAAASRLASGRIEAQVQDRKPAEVTPDRLTLSKAPASARGADAKTTEDRIARERADQDMTQRLAELNKNIAELNRLGAASGAVPAGATASAAGTGIAAALPGASAPADTASAASPAASEAAPAASTASGAVPASPPASAPVGGAAAPAPSASDGGVLGFLMDNPLIPAAGGGILALLAGLVALRMRRHKQAPQVDSSFLESRLQPDSFFGASGGQHINTAEDPAVDGASLVYSPSQIDAAGDVDPVAEADVYLAYGRDLQAEEILKEALRASPERTAIHTKLLEIYARRRDVQAFERLALDAHALTGGAGPQWSHISDLGQALDPGNPLYHASSDSALSLTPAPSTFGDGASQTERAPLPAVPADEIDPSQAGPSTQPFAVTQAGEADEASAPAAAAHAPLDFDLSAIDLELPTLPKRESTAASAPLQAPAAAPAPAAPLADATVAPPLELAPAAEPERVLPELPAYLPGTMSPQEAASTAVPPPLPQALMDLDLEIPSLRPASSPLPAPAGPALDTLPDSSLTPPGAARPGAPLGGMIDFDLASISLDLKPAVSRPPAPAAPASTAAATPPAPATPDDPFDSLPSLPLLEPQTTADLTTAQPSDLPGAQTEVDPLATKLALAEEFHAIGDADGARSLAEEVRDEATGDMRRRAERLLGELG